MEYQVVAERLSERFETRVAVQEVKKYGVGQGINDIELGDFDNDGFLDLFVQNWNGLDSHLYMGNGDGTFWKVTS